MTDRIGEDPIRQGRQRQCLQEEPNSWYAHPERATATTELRGLSERAIDDLPTSDRLVSVLREVEGLSTAETAAALQLGATW